MLIYAFGAAGTVLSVLLLTVFTSRTMLKLSLVLNLVGLGVTVLAESLNVATIGLTINFMGRYMQTGLVFSFTSEFKAQEVKMKHMNVLGVLYSAGPLLMALAYWLIPSWEVTLLVTQILPLAASLVMILLWVEEAPINLLLNSSSSSALLGFQRVAAFNGVECDIK